MTKLDMKRLPPKTPSTRLEVLAFRDEKTGFFFAFDRVSGHNEEEASDFRGGRERRCPSR